MSSFIDGITLNSGEEFRAILGKEHCGTNGQKPVMVLTNKHILFFGEHYRYDNGDVSRKSYEAESVPLNDFIGAGYIRKRSRRNLYYLTSIGVLITVLSLISKELKKFGLHFSTLKHSIWIMVGLFIIVLALYLFKRYRLFEIAFIGKRLCVKERHYHRAEIQQFIQAVYQIKREKKH
jgi:hypothetical protein